MKRWMAFFIVFIGASSYGVLATLVKMGYQQGFHVGQITGSQMLIGCLILWGLALPTIKHLKRLSFMTIGKMILLGPLVGLTGVFYYSALQYIPASIAIVLLFQFTWVGALYEYVLERKKPTRQTALSLLLILIGTLFAANAFNVALYRDTPLIGWLLGLCSAFTYAGFIYVSGKVALDVSPWIRSALMVTGSVLTIFVIFPPVDLISRVWLDGLLLLGLGLAFFGAVFPTICFTIGVPKIGPGIATVLSSVELPIVVFMAWFVLSEEVVWTQWIGVILIIFAIALNQLQFRRKEYSTENI